MSFMSAVYETLDTLKDRLTEFVKMYDRAKRIVKLIDEVKKSYTPRGEPDQLVLKSFNLLAERAGEVLEAQKVLELPVLRVFCEALVESDSYKSILARVISRVKPPARGVVVEFNSVSGIVLEMASTRLKREVYAVNQIEDLAEMVEERFYRKGLKVHLLKESFEKIGSIIGQPIGVILAVSPLNWLYDLRRLSSKANTLLEYGGTYVVVYPDRSKLTPLEPYLKLLKADETVNLSYFIEFHLSSDFRKVKYWSTDDMVSIIAQKV